MLFQVGERGPFVYRERVRKVGVRWVSNTVEFHEYTEQTFDPILTQSECPDCQEREPVRRRGSGGRKERERWEQRQKERYLR